MHLIVAGAARAGKTTLSMRLNDKGYIHYKMDSIKRGICEAYHLKYDNWEELSPIMCKIINRMIEDNQTDTNYLKEKYLFDTPFIYPKDIKTINTEDTLVFFIGYSKLSYQEVFKRIREHDEANIWTSKIDDLKLMKWCQDNVEFSKYLEKECASLGIKYFDTSNNREEVLDSIVSYIENMEEKQRQFVKKIKVCDTMKYGGNL